MLTAPAPRGRTRPAVAAVAEDARDVIATTTPNPNTSRSWAWWKRSRSRMPAPVVAHKERGTVETATRRHPHDSARSPNSPGPAARFRTLFAIQHSGNSGSPRVQVAAFQLRGCSIRQRWGRGRDDASGARPSRGSAARAGRFLSRHAFHGSYEAPYRFGRAPRVQRLPQVSRIGKP